MGYLASEERTSFCASVMGETSGWEPCCAFGGSLLLFSYVFIQFIVFYYLYLTDLLSGPV